MKKHELESLLIRVFREKDTILLACAKRDCVYFWDTACHLKDIAIDENGQCIHWKWQLKKIPPMVRPIRKGK